MVFRHRKPVKHRKKVLMIDASSEFKKGRAQNELLHEHVDQIYQWYETHEDVEGVARFVSLDEIKENDFNLNISRYVEPVGEEETITGAEEVENLKASLQSAYEAEDRLSQLIQEPDLMNDSQM